MTDDKTERKQTMDSIRINTNKYTIWFMCVVISTLILCTGILLSNLQLMLISVVIMGAVILYGVGKAFIMDFF